MTRIYAHVLLGGGAYGNRVQISCKTEGIFRSKSFRRGYLKQFRQPDSKNFPFCFNQGGAYKRRSSFGWHNAVFSANLEDVSLSRFRSHPNFIYSVGFGMVRHLL